MSHGIIVFCNYYPDKRVLLASQPNKREAMTSATLDDELRADALDLQAALTDLVRAYQFRDRDAICCYDVSLGQSHALDRLALGGPMTLNELAAALYLEKSSASRLADALERKGYITRKPHPDDARYVQIELTKPGRLLADKLQDDMVRERAEMLRELPPLDRKTVVRSIVKLAQAATSGVDTTNGCCVVR
jgi:DNA-binding MarR family transcriptional regulator